MKARKFLWLLPVLAVVGYVACRKTDRLTTEDPSPQVKESRFFSEHKSSNPQVQGIADYVKRQNDKLGFVEKTTQMIGYPRWDKTLSFKKPGVNKNGKGNYTESEDSASIYYIPFVRDSQNYVNATMVVKTIQNDTTFNYLCDWQYHNRPHGSPYSDSTAEKFALLFMLMDNRTLEHTEFNITDIELFPESVPGPDGRKKLKLTNISTSNNLIETFTYVELCVDFYVCGDVAYCEAHGGCDYLNCAAGPGEPGHCYLVSSVCEGWWEDTGGGGSGGGSGSGSGGTGGTGGGSGGGGTGGGGTPPPCGGAITPTSNLIETNAPCTPGWGPILPDEPDVPLNDTTIAMRLKRLITKAQVTIDSLHTKSQEDNKERTFTYIKTPTDTSVMWIREGTSHTSSPTLAQNACAIFHTHYEDDPTGGTDRNQCFDGPDLYKVYKNFAIDKFPIETSIISTRDFFYAFVIVDVNKFRSFIRTLCNSIDIRIIAETLYNLHIDGMNSCTGSCTWQKMTEIGFLNITGNGNSELSGVKVFISPRSNINFTILTQ